MGISTSRTQATLIVAQTSCEVAGRLGNHYERRCRRRSPNKDLAHICNVEVPESNH